MSTLERELRLTQQELAESRRHAEDQSSELDKAKAQILELHNAAAANYESSVPIVTQLKSFIETTSNLEIENLNKRLAECHRMMNKQQKAHEEKVHDLQQRNGMTIGHLQSKNSELQAQLEDKTKECEQAVTKLRSEVQTVRAEKEHLEKNFEKISVELNKARNERKEAQDRLEKYKTFVDQVANNWNNQLENALVLALDTNQQHEQDENLPKRSRRN